VIFHGLSLSTYSITLAGGRRGWGAGQNKDKDKVECNCKLLPLLADEVGQSWEGVGEVGVDDPRHQVGAGGGRCITSYSSLVASTFSLTGAAEAGDLFSFAASSRLAYVSQVKI